MMSSEIRNLKEDIGSHEVKITFSYSGLSYEFHWRALYEDFYIAIYRYYRMSTEFARIDSMTTKNVETKNRAIELINNYCKEQEIPYQIEIK
jgi:hypothetical protein